MIKYIDGDIFKSPAQVIVNPVNTDGVMGKGLALQFKKKYPEMFQAYKKACEKDSLKIGNLMLWKATDYWILIFPTKEHWRNPSKLEYIEKGLDKFARTYADKGIQSIAFPKLGCGNGELEWEQVNSLMKQYLQKLPIDIYIYIGNSIKITPEHKTPKKTLDWLRANAKDMSFKGVIDDITIQSQMLPIEFQYKRCTAEGLYRDKMIFSFNNKQVQIEYDELYEIWDDIRNSRIFYDSENDRISLFYHLLLKLGYLSKVNILYDKTGERVPGFQLNEGNGRIYGLVEG